MKKTNKKGFTIVELVIVIAVIAILAGVMIPTFSGIIKTAQESAEMQKVAAAYKEAYALALTDDGVIDESDFGEDGIEVSGYTFTLAEDGETWELADSAKFSYTYSDGAWTVESLDD